MLAKSWILCALGFFVGRGVAADNCTTNAPIVLPLKNATLGDGIAINRGMVVMIADQSTSLRPSFDFNVTLIRNGRDCYILPNLTAIDGCLGASGSIFNITSTSFTPATDGTFNVPYLDSPPVGATIAQGYVNATFSGGLLVPDLPLEVWSDQTALNKSGIALGPSSSVLQMLMSLGKIPSRIMGLFFGSRSQNFGVDGALTIGGYAPSRLNGSFTNFSLGKQYLSTPCPLQVPIKDILLNNASGSHSLFPDREATVFACIDPLQNSFSFTQAMLDQFHNLTNHTVIAADGSANYTDQTYPLDKEPLIGTLTVILDDGADGYTSVIPHYEMVSLERGTDDEGKYGVVNNSRIQAAVQVDAGDNDIGGPILGGVFLSQNYLLVDYSREIFRLAPAVVGKMDDSAAAITKVCELGSSESGEPAKKKANAGAIAGGVIGGVVGALVVIVGGIVLWKRYTRRPVAATEEEEPRSHADAPEVDRAPESGDSVAPLPRRDTLASELGSEDRRNSEMLSPVLSELGGPVAEKDAHGPVVVEPVELHAVPANLNAQDA